MSSYYRAIQLIQFNELLETNFCSGKLDDTLFVRLVEMNITMNWMGTGVQYFQPNDFQMKNEKCLGNDADE